MNIDQQGRGCVSCVLTGACFDRSDLSSDYLQCIIIKGAILSCDIIKRANALSREHNAIIYELRDCLLIRIRTWL